MAGNNTFAALRTQVGVAKEAVKGTAVAATAFPAVKTFNAAIKQTKLIDNGWRGSMGTDFGMQNGVRSAELDINGDVFADTIGWLLAGIMGADDVTGASAPYTHTIGLKNGGDGQPTSQTWTDNEGGLQGRQYPGAQISECTLKFDASGLMGFDAKALSFVGGTTTPPAATYSTLVPIPSWTGAVSIAGTSVATVQNMEVAIKRNNAEAIFTLGTQDPYQIHVGELEVTTKYTFVAADESRLLAYLNNTMEAITATFTQSASQSVMVQMSQHYFDDAKVTRGKTYMEIEGTGRAIFNATDSTTSGTGLSPVQFVLKNALPAATYL